MNEYRIKQVLTLSAVAVVTLVIALSAKGVILGSAAAPASSPTGAAVAPVAAGEFQDVKLTMDANYEYQLEPSTLTKGIPVKMEADMGTLYGCMRDITIPSFGVRKYVKEGDNIIEFTPDKTGTFRIACSMNMGVGSFEVVEADGTRSTFVEETPQAAPGGSCGAGGAGGCGCGG